MSSDILKPFLQESGLSQGDFARLVGVTTRAVALWMTGERAIAGPVEAYIRIFRLLPASLRQIELNRLKDRGSGMRDGMFGVTFSGQHGSGMGMIVLDSGRVYGTDTEGARYDGEYIFHENTSLVDVVVKVTFPPNVMSVFGISNPYEWSIDVSTSFNPRLNSGALEARTSLGKPLAAQFRFLRSLPDAA